MTKDKPYKEPKIISHTVRKMTQTEKEGYINPACWGFDPVISTTIYIDGRISIVCYCKNDDIHLAPRRKQYKDKHI